MDLDPQKFFIGVIDFFSIIMPGALLAYLWKDCAVLTVLGRPELPLTSTENWLIFLFMAYLLGHIVFLLGAWFMDELYDWVRGCTYLGMIRRLADGQKLNSWVTRMLARRLFLDRSKYPNRVLRTLANCLFDKNADTALIAAAKLKSQALATLGDEGAVNAFQWCKAKLSQQHVQGLVAVQRFEADSKFFRSFAIVLLLQAVFYGIQQRWFLVGGCAILLVLTVWRYADQRFKSTQQAYWQVVTMESLQPRPKTPPQPKPKHPTHGGGVVFKDEGGIIQYLLVRSSIRDEWVLPKGHIEWGESARQAAVREVREESGYWAEAGRMLKDIQLRDGSSTPLVRFFLMKLVNKDKVSSLENRKPTWFPLLEAQEKASFVDTKKLLALADACLKNWDNQEPCDSGEATNPTS